MYDSNSSKKVTHPIGIQPAKPSFMSDVKHKIQKNKINKKLKRIRFKFSTEKKTLPDILEIKKSKIHGEGVFALKNIPKGIKFGPYDGIENVKRKFGPYDGIENVKSITGYAWRIRGGKFLDAIQVKYSYWLRYVNCARNVGEQNLVPFQFEGNIYYRSVKQIAEGEELLVFYSDEFAKILNIDFNNSGQRSYENCLPKITYHPDNKPVDGIVPCPFCPVYLINLECLQTHLKYCGQRFKNACRLI
ncbi:hypothetical protein QE152_g3585 [Popillia japonica]|uniref:SET domain-containing protein n=1 Tax=Popillia japonica TaxID=7064 RepID=A0AAW1N3Q4_POPJA